VRYRAEYRSELERRHNTWELGVRRDKAAALGRLASAFLKVNKRSPLSLDRLPQSLAFVKGRHGSGLNALIDLVCVQGRGSSCGCDPSHCPHFSRLP
jgi:hypothetical protein